MQAPQSTSETLRPEERSQEFVAVQGGTETTSAATLLVAAYLFMWALLFGFIYLSWRKQHAINTRISRLEAALAKREGAD
jgi:CcmD family protein